MATQTAPRAAQPNLAPARADKILAFLCVAMLLAVAVSLGRGASEWGRLPGLVWFHLGTIALALALTPVMLLRRRGDRLHRALGYVWTAAILATAISTFWITESNPGRWSPIHLLSVFTLVMVPRVILAARNHRAHAHRQGIRFVVAGALIVAGFFTFMPDRMLGHWLLG